MTREPVAWIAVLAGAGLCFIAYDDGGYALATRGTVAIVVWWTVVAGLAFGVWPLVRVPPGAAVTAALLALFAGWQLLSTAWASSAERAVNEFDRTALYLGVLVLTSLVSRRADLRRWLDALTAAIVLIGVIALVSRLFPGSFPGRDLPAVLPSSSTRLSFPLDYWNGLGVFVAMAVPLLLYDTLAPGRPRRVAGAAALPALAAVVYLTSSRGAVIAAVIGALVLVVGQPRRWTALARASGCALGCAGAVLLVAWRAQGWEAACLLVAACLLTALLAEAVVGAEARGVRLGRTPRRVLVGLTVAAVVAAVAVGAGRLGSFTRVPDVSAATTTSGHLLSGAGSGRWQFWQAAFREFEHAPLQGGGAGSFASWWSRHASFSYAIQDAHSLFLQTLGELGLVGLLLLLAWLGTGVGVGVRRLARAPAGERAAIAALLGAFATFLLGAAVDWMWELAAVTVAGVLVLGLLTGPATADDGPPRRRPGTRLALCLAGAAILVLEAIPLLAAVEVGASRAAVRAGNARSARSHAVAATRIQPWAATPWLQLALVEEAAGDLDAARTAAARAIARDRLDWQPWYVAAGIERRLGHRAAAAADVARARSLDPRSPLF
jgi:O-antigen ligase